ncbi:MAG: CPBP family intramembrane metalloprotease [Candidatus Latescibacterota bacterium]|nr:MAG: CPBP family intramembrane metalloprotease [Candidatus Latescibacterota bacterium]
MSPVPRARMLRLALLLEGALLVVAVGLGWILDTPILAALRFDRDSLLLGVAATLPMLLLLVWVSHSSWSGFQRLGRKVEELVEILFGNARWTDIAFVSCLAGAGEEALFRGVIQVVLARALDPAVALLVASLIFGLAHAVTPLYVVLVTVTGLYLGGLFMLFDNLLIPIVVHASYDFIAILYLRKRASRSAPLAPYDAL